jgi:uncharacterized protein
MSIALYHIAIPPMVRSIGNLKAILIKAEAYAESKNIDPAALITARLFPDMYPLARQVQIASDMAKGAAARLSEQEPPQFEDSESNFAELIARLDKTLEFLATITPDQINNAAQHIIEVPRRDRISSFTGLDYLCDYALPNLYFHVATAYAILRHNGLDLDKRDFLGDVG